jgi:undecaprenyl-diphosphatase
MRLNIIQGFILGLIQGLTEFLPISSTGHLVLFQKLFGLTGGTVTFDIAVHLATLIGVCIVLKDDIIAIFKKPLGKMTLLIITATIPTLIIGATFSHLIKSLLESGKSLGLEFIFTGVVLWYAETVRSRNKGLEQTTYTDAGIIGIAQGIAILPAVSRSGLTLAGALSRGLNREFALRFSFLLSIPAILAATALDAYDAVKAGSLGANMGAAPLIVGMLVAAVTGYFAVKFMIRIFSKTSLKVFSYYVFVLGGLILVDQIFFHFFFSF